MIKLKKYLLFSAILNLIFCNETISTSKDQKNYNYYKLKNTAVLVAAYNRPKYLKKMLKSVEQNPESRILPFYFFLDGGPNSSQNENKKLILDSKIKNKKIILRSYNFGCGNNLIEARRYLFDECKYSLVIVLEDDIVISPYYIKLLLSFYNWANSKYDNIGIVSLWNKCFLSLKQKQKQLKYCHNTVFTSLGYCIDIRVWQDISKTIYEYQDKFIKDREYKYRNHKSIRNWYKQQLEQNQCNLYKQPYKVNLSIKSKLTSLKSPTGQDSTLSCALYCKGYVELSTIVNRLIHIGKDGVHCNSKNWDDYGFGKMKLDLFKKDKKLNHFTPYTPHLSL